MAASSAFVSSAPSSRVVSVVCASFVVQAPRATWCPGRVTPPFVLEGALAAGPHTLRFEVGPNIAEGGSWFTSATAFFYGA